MSLNCHIANLSRFGDFAQLNQRTDPVSKRGQWFAAQILLLASRKNKICISIFDKQWGVYMLLIYAL